ncbi:MAG: glycosyltransferase [Prevotellaceae bacterium]|nr:glycosyltransferase [Prevotellaceae bacterium]
MNVLTRSGVLAYILKKTQKIPYIIIEHWSRYLPENNSYNGFLRKIVTFLVARKAAAILPVSKSLEKAMKNKGIVNKNYKVVNNVVDDFFFMPSPSLISFKDEPKTILHISCFSDEAKNISGILQATKMLLQKRNDFKLILIGDGVDFENIRSISEQLSLQKNVFFLGEKKPQDVYHWLNRCAFTVLFSNYENAPVVISESLAAGKPVVATDVGGISEMINKQNGILIPIKNTEKLAEAMNEMLDNFEKYPSKRISEQAYKDYSFEYTGKRLFEIYKETLRQYDKNKYTFHNECQTGNTL